MNPSVCHRTATYAGKDGFNRERHATIPIPDDMTPSKTITRMGLTMTLVAVNKIDPEPQDWFLTAGIICRPQSL